MKKAKLIAIVTIIIVMIILIVGIWISINNKSEGRDDSDYLSFWDPHIGSYIEYRIVENTQNVTDYRNYTIMATITNIEGLNEAIHVVWHNSQDVVILNKTQSFPWNLTFGNEYDINHPRYYDITEVRTENLTTIWGERACIVYHVVGYGWDEYFWVHNGVMLKEVVVAIDPWQIQGVLMLIDTNIPEITHL